jgi:hypothetical protein
MAIPFERSQILIKHRRSKHAGLEKAEIQIANAAADRVTAEPDTYFVYAIDVSQPEWVACFRKWQIRVRFKEPKPNGLIFARFYNLGNNPTGPKAGPHSQFYRDVVIANGGVEPPRRDRLPRTIFLKKPFRVEVVTVTHDRDDKPYAPDAQYSVIRSIELVSDEPDHY